MLTLTDMFRGSCASEMRMHIAFMLLKASCRHLRTHFRYLSDFAVVVAILVFVWYILVIAAAGVVAGVSVAALVVDALVGAVAGDDEHGIGGEGGAVVLVLVGAVLPTNW